MYMFPFLEILISNTNVIGCKTVSKRMIVRCSTVRNSCLLNCAHCAAWHNTTSSIIDYEQFDHMDKKSRMCSFEIHM